MSIDLPVLRAVISGKASAVCAWEPQNISVIAGRSSIIEKEIITENCIRDNVPIFCRRTGGGSVVLAPGMLVFSFAERLIEKKPNWKYIEKINNKIIKILESVGVTGARQAGVSDLTINNRKIMGSGLYVGRDVLFFQGVILINPDFLLFEKYLRHPLREPDYRKGRRHGDFLTSLWQEGFYVKISKIKRKILEM